MRTGDSLSFNVYGCRIDRVIDPNGNKLKCVFCKYETNPGFDYFNEVLEPMQVMKNIKFYATKKFERSVTVDAKFDLGATPYNLVDLIKANDLSNAWSQVNGFAPAQLRIAIVSLSTVGLEHVSEWLSVDYTNRYNSLLLETPDLLSYHSLDGSPMFKITYSGCLVAPVLKSYQLSLEVAVPPISAANQANLDANGENLVEELFSYNIASVAGLPVLPAAPL